MNQPDPKLTVAPMMAWTDRHCRFLLRQYAPHALLFTEMVTSAAVVHGDPTHLLGFNVAEHPVAVQLGGSDPEQLAEAARICAEFGYDEINLNVGCPSDRVQSGRFGACLMADPELVATCVEAMKATVTLPVTVKCRIGIDDQDAGQSLDRFARCVVAAGADALYVHARKAWLQGLSPKQNRDVPPLDYPRVHRLAAELAPFPVYINGGIETVAEAQSHVQATSGVMMGRGAYHNPKDDLKRLPREAILKNVYHQRYMIRAQAAKALRAVEAFDELENLLRDPDPRVRRAAGGLRSCPAQCPRRHPEW